MTDSPSNLIFSATDLIAKPGSKRQVRASERLQLSYEDVAIDDDVLVDAGLTAISGGVMASVVAEVDATLNCTRCLTGWTEPIRASFDQFYGVEPDEDGYSLDRDANVDLSGPVRDEIGLLIPSAPVCRSDCRGLCPQCGTDLNTDPCDGHVEEIDSPFAVLKDLLDP